MALSTKQRFLANTDIIAAIGMVGIVVMMVVPLPSGMLDILITLNITASILTMMLAVFAKDPLEFSALPSLLLALTLFRLSLNISATRLILLDGHAGEIIQQFGEFVIRGNAVVGFIIFIILVLVQFIVITKGAERVSEVAARFTLDAMPGKQMSIDADLNAGMINELQARDRRKAIQQEADFYGAMDGSTKFVKGDAIAAIIILFINIIGGFITGVVMQDMPLLEALHKYTLLTIGDGLVSQIPALLISTATGLVVTRAASENNLGEDLVKQLFRQPKALFITAGVLSMLAFLGLPKFPLFTVSAALIAMGVMLQRNSKVSVVEETAAARESEIEESKKPENVLNLLNIDHMELELGYALIALVDVQQGGDLLDRIVLIRRQIASELGFIVPVIRVRDNMNLQPNQYVIKIRGAELATGELLADHFMSMSNGFEDNSIPGIPTKEPAFGLDAIWINAIYREQAELNGWMVVDAPTVLATHITEVIKSQAWEILSRQDVKTLIDHAKELAPTVVDELIPELLSLGQVQKVLANLLRERVSIRDMVTILETLADQAHGTKDLDRLTEHVRQGLARQILQPLLGKDKNLPVMTLDPQIEQQILDSIQPSDYGTYLALDPKILQILMQNLTREVEKVILKGFTPVIVCAPLVRINLKRVTERQLPQLMVLSYNELVQGVQVQAVGMVGMDRAS
ncbi:flagellar biosynthesis protein FlhA [Desulfosporosinus sp. BICA1-9]|uniref:flagellar biosynthesis protein FlhA n=1 Tax=Desulfosporosinus sp. BICA1-9 TaxID=1531958 RepID=UPI00054B6A78|nr:flagellar biosynthesis protein FlhA [Desulfosporosinus sp. BICA1-9]KJS47201.1 MAG: flagellar biosynthesis protein FlhA [Peptococcaceae bacterium BRH_c23]KJS90014.1 MAG: flagellar biosynthesis protein FlhA [Desulfosporosinus sp. BICA1-9]HBW36422.1 flagellar biosynthesis protein FlhA [Desulfosporosinus sp.]